MQGVDLDERRGGLPCRAGCELSFRPVIDTVLAIGVAAIERNQHEAEVHAYVHPAPKPPLNRWGKNTAADWGYQPGWNRKKAQA